MNVTTTQIILIFFSTSLYVYTMHKEFPSLHTLCVQKVIQELLSAQSNQNNQTNLLNTIPTILSTSYQKLITHTLLQQIPTGRRSIKDYLIQLVPIPSREFKGHNYVVTHVALSSNKKCIISSDFRGNIRVWDVVTGQTKHTFTYNNRMCSIALSNDNTIIIIIDYENHIKIVLRDIYTHNTHSILLKSHRDCACSTQLGNKHLSIDIAYKKGILDPFITMWMIHQNQKTLMYTYPAYHTKTLCNDLSIYNLNTPISIIGCACIADSNRNIYRILKGHTERISSSQLSTDKNVFITGSSDKTIRIWDLTLFNTIVNENISLEQALKAYKIIKNYHEPQKISDQLGKLFPNSYTSYKN